MWKVTTDNGDGSQSHSYFDNEEYANRFAKVYDLLSYFGRSSKVYKEDLPDYYETCEEALCDVFGENWREENEYEDGDEEDEE